MFFLFVLFSSLTTGGRWDLNEQIAFGQRLIDGISMYANGESDLFPPSSPYFPGVAYLSYTYSYLGIADIQINNQFMLFSAVTVGFIYFFLLYKLTRLMYPKIPQNMALTLLVLIIATHFPKYIMYMKEFKPDTIMLLLGLAALFILEKKEKLNFFNFVAVGVLLFFTVFFKQSFFIIFFLIYLLIFFHGSITKKQKVCLIAGYSLVGISALIIIFDIENIYFFTVEIMSKHPMLDIKEVLGFFGSGTIRNILFCFALIYFLRKRYKLFSLKQLESKYFIFAVVWFLFSAVSTMKMGGNKGNYEAGLIVLTPYAIFAINAILSKFYSSKHFNNFILFTLILTISIYSNKSIESVNEYMTKIEQDRISLQYISENYKNKSAFVDGNTYVLAKKAGLHILTEAETVEHFNNVPGYDLSRLKEAIKEQKYDVIFVKKYFSYFKDEDIHKIFSEKYTLLDDKNLPLHLVGKIYIQLKGN